MSNLAERLEEQYLAGVINAEVLREEDIFTFLARKTGSTSTPKMWQDFFKGHPEIDPKKLSDAFKNKKIDPKKLVHLLLDNPAAIQRVHDVIGESINPEQSFKDKDGMVHYRKYFKSDKSFKDAEEYAKGDFRSVPSKDKNTFLHRIGIQGEVAVLKHPNVDKVKNNAGQTPLHFLASSLSTPSTAASVLKHPSIDIVRDNKGNTPLHHLAASRNQEIALNHPSVDKVKNNAGQTPRDIYKQYKK